MTIHLKDYEDGLSLDEDYAEALKAVQKRLARIQYRHIIHGHHSIVMFEGWDAAGKGGVIRRLTAEWDPRYFQVHSIGAPTPEELDRHFLWRFWTKMPGRRSIGVFDRSWYGRVLVERVEGFASKAEWKRGYDEINEFEAQLTGNGITLVKIFVHVTQDAQDKRFAERLDNPFKRWKLTKDDFRNRTKRDAYLEAMDEMFAETDTRWAPWTVFDGNAKKPARIAILNHVADTLDAALPDDLPEADPEIVAMAKKALGYEEEG